MERRHIGGHRPHGSELSVAQIGGRKGDLSRFVDRVVRQAIFWETVETLQERNRCLSAEEAQALADEAVVQARADRS